MLTEVTVKSAMSGEQGLRANTDYVQSIARG
jgi:hypothetical protein